MPVPAFISFPLLRRTLACSQPLSFGRSFAPHPVRYSSIDSTNSSRLVSFHLLSALKTFLLRLPPTTDRLRSFPVRGASTYSTNSINSSRQKISPSISHTYCTNTCVSCVRHGAIHACAWSTRYHSTPAECAKCSYAACSMNRRPIGQA